MNKSLKFFLPVVFAFIFSNLSGQDKVIDKVVAVVGGNIILLSDVENQYLQYIMSGATEVGNIKCELFEELMFQKLLLNQAELDSIIVSDSQVESEMDRRLRYFINQIGSEKKLEEYYSKSILEIKEEMREYIRNQLMVDQIKHKVTENIKVTPSEVKSFFKSIPIDSLPLISSELEIAIITKEPVLTIEEKKEVYDKIDELRKRIVAGENFSVLARLYSEDPGSIQKGGDLGFFSRGQMQPEFEAAAFALKKGEVSPVIETKFGFHIIQMIERRGDNINVRHILMRAKPSAAALESAKSKLDSVLALIRKDSLSFETAAFLFSDDPSKNNNGIMVNPNSGSIKFTPDELDPKLFFVIEKMNVGEISEPLPMMTENISEAYKIILLKSRTLPHIANLTDDYYKLQEMALADKKQKAINNWIKSKTKNTYINISDDTYRNCNLMFNWINK